MTSLSALIDILCLPVGLYSCLITHSLALFGSSSLCTGDGFGALSRAPSAELSHCPQHSAEEGRLLADPQEKQDRHFQCSTQTST